MRSGRILLALLLLIGIAGVLTTGAAIYSRFIYLSLLLGVGSWVWTRWSASGMGLQRFSRLQRANVGDIFEEHFEVANNSRVIAPWIEVYNQSPIPFVSGSRLFTFVLGRQKRTHLARTWLTRRGGFPLGPTRISTGDPFGLFRVSKEIPASQTLVVLPMIFEIKSFLFPPGLLPGGQVIRRKSPDVTPHAAGVREYVHGDAMKRIHWPTSIRRNHLMVKEFEQDPQAEIWLFLDLHRDVHLEKAYQFDEISVEAMMFGKRPRFQLPPSTLEYAITITASLTHYFIERHRAVGYASAGNTFTVHPADRSERQEGKVLETLAFVEANGKLSLAALVSAQSAQMPQGSSAILVTPSTRPDLLLAVDDLQRRYLRPVVILLDGETFGGRRGSTAGLVRALRERRVPVCVVACDANLSETLSEFSTEFISQDIRTWQTPVLSQ
ncbi:MAG TPA: DUF58 domain-containing protein [Anaerolineales bacterium]|nr:DUF58 domain-containing protein [Anaerolineales bacterium]HNJ14055.1 DUF58 domain-containing protein [Anaerolineales bacterium]